MKKLEKFLWIIGEVVISTVFTVVLFAWEVLDPKESPESVKSGLRNRFYIVKTTPIHRWREVQSVPKHERLR